MASLDPLPSALADSLAQFPSRGERNLWLFTIAARARHVASPDKVHTFLSRIAAHAGWTDRDFTKEITRAIDRAFNPQPAPQKYSRPRTSDLRPSTKYNWPEFDPSLWDHYVSTPPLFENLEDPAASINTADILDLLYNPDDLLCLALDIRSAVTQPRSDWRGMESAMEFIVANPMTALSGRTQDGRLSHRCHDNATTSRIYQVIEFDRGSPDEQAAILSALHSDRAPLVMVVWSGGKSMHGWFVVRHLTETDKVRFFSMACMLGADRSLWDPCKLVRMPGGRRVTGESQPVLYFNPDVA
jgi:hypothetical protein